MCVSCVVLVGAQECRGMPIGTQYLTKKGLFFVEWGPYGTSDQPLVRSGQEGTGVQPPPSRYCRYALLRASESAPSDV